MSNAFSFIPYYWFFNFYKNALLFASFSFYISYLDLTLLILFTAFCLSSSTNCIFFTDGIVLFVWLRRFKRPRFSFITFCCICLFYTLNWENTYRFWNLRESKNDWSSILTKNCLCEAPLYVSFNRFVVFSDSSLSSFKAKFYTEPTWAKLLLITIFVASEGLDDLRKEGFSNSVYEFQFLVERPILCLFFVVKLKLVKFLARLKFSRIISAFSYLRWYSFIAWNDFTRYKWKS